MSCNQRKKRRWLVIIFAFIMFLPFDYFTFYSSASAATVGTVTAGTLNVRTGAGTNYSLLKSGNTIVRLKKGSKVTINSTKGNWYHVTFSFNKKSLKGYVSKAYVTTKKTSSSSTKKGTSTTNNLNVRTGAGTNYSRIIYAGKRIQLSKGKAVNILSEKVIGIM